MAQFFSAICFSLAAVGALALLAGMLRREGTRVMAILAGEELVAARAMATPPIRVRARAWRSPVRKPVQPLRAAA